MKVKILSILALAVVPILAFAATAGAQTFRSGQTANVAASETIDGSAFIAGSAVDIAGKVNGDLYCAGQNITISGEVDGDVICAGQTITLSGTVSGDVRVAGQTVAISGDIKGSASGAGQTITVEGAGKVGRDALLLGQSINVNGQVGRDVVVSSSSASLSAAVGRNVTAYTDTLTLDKGANVAGHLDYTSPNKLSKNDGANVAGKISYTERKAEQHQEKGYNVGATILWGIMLLVSTLIFALLFPRELRVTTDQSLTTPAKALFAVGIGVVAGIIMPVVIILLMITVFGIPFALVVLVAWILIVAVSGVFAACYLGRLIWRSQTNIVLATLVGAAIIVIVLAIPILNVLGWLLAVWYGTGVILLQLKKLAATPNYSMRAQKSRGRT